MTWPGSSSATNRNWPILTLQSTLRATEDRTWLLLFCGNICSSVPHTPVHRPWGYTGAGRENQCPLTKGGKRKRAMAPMCSYLFGGAPLPPEKTRRYRQEMAFHVLSPMKTWQRLTSNQRMSEFSKWTLVFLGFRNQPATLGPSTKPTTAVICTRLVNCLGLCSLLGLR